MKEDTKQKISFSVFRDEVLADYRLAHISRHCSVVARKEVLTGKAPKTVEEIEALMAA